MLGNFPDHYAALNVPRTATQREIARAYRSLLRTHHPDLAGPTAAPAELQLIMQAFEVLRDPRRRLAYDREVLGNDANEQGPAPAGPRASPSGDHSREVPVRHVRHEDPPLRATPVRWESGPWATIRFNPRGEQRR